MSYEIRFEKIENRLDLIENRLEQYEYKSQQLEKALKKLRKSDFSFKDSEERNWMVTAAVKFAGWKRKKVAEIFNMSSAQVGNIINNPEYT